MSVILLISPEPWTGHFVSKHHYSVTLSKEGYDVYFLNPPKNSLKDIIIQKTKYKNLWEVFSPQSAKGLRFYPKFLRNYVERKWLERLEEHMGTKFTTIWLFENSRFYDMDFAGRRTKIYHQVDLNQNFHAREASASGDVSFCTTDFIKDELRRFTQQVHKVHHGVTLKCKEHHLAKEEEQYFNSRPVNVVYIGNLDIPFFDVVLFVSLVSTFSEVTFHLVGHYSQDKTLFMACKKYSNIKWWGRQESSKLPAILALSDIQLLIYKSQNNEETKQLASPHKMMEYLLSGKVTVATYTDEYKDKRELLEMVDDSSDFLAKFDEVVNTLAVYNSEKKQKMRKDFAREHSYEKQLAKIVAYLKEYNLKL